MTEICKAFDSLTANDLETHPVWEFAGRADMDDDVVVPCDAVPVNSTAGKLFASKVRLANGSMERAVIGNIDGANEKSTKHFLSLSILKNETWFMLARYHDVAADKRSPELLAEFLSLSLSEVFPIHYDISKLARGQRWSLIGLVELNPPERLSDKDLIELSLL